MFAAAPIAAPTAAVTALAPAVGFAGTSLGEATKVSLGLTDKTSAVLGVSAPFAEHIASTVAQVAIQKGVAGAATMSTIATKALPKISGFTTGLSVGVDVAAIVSDATAVAKAQADYESAISKVVSALPNE